MLCCEDVAEIAAQPSRLVGFQARPDAEARRPTGGH